MLILFMYIKIKMTHRHANGDVEVFNYIFWYCQSAVLLTH